MKFHKLKIFKKAIIKLLKYRILWNLCLSAHLFMYAYIAICISNLCLSISSYAYFLYNYVFLSLSISLSIYPAIPQVIRRAGYLEGNRREEG